MLSAEVSTFGQQARLAVALSFVAGFTNAVAFVVGRNFISHMTGNSTMVGLTAAGGSWRELAFYAGAVGAFGLGGVTSAIMTELAIRRGAARARYILPVAAEAALLTGLTLWLGGSGEGAMTRGWLFAAAFAMGLQNATITKISGAVVRSTHLTGVVTDLGIESVQMALYLLDRRRGRTWLGFISPGRVLRLTQRHPTGQRLALLACIWTSFVFGAGVGAVGFAHVGARALLAPVGVLLGLVVVTYRNVRRRAAQGGIAVERRAAESEDAWS
ncbi:MAG TPA: YoaK family protein [Phycisphaerae bacterium]|nr:YoaK family protein [Phycisphaerae bacterium]